jgi:hypothetical protein
MTYADIVLSPAFPTYNIWPNNPFDVPARKRTATREKKRHFKISKTIGPNPLLAIGKPMQMI